MDRLSQAAMAAFLFASGCHADRQATDNPSPGATDISPSPETSAAQAIDDGIRTISFEEAGLDRAPIEAGIQAIKAGAYGNIHSLLIFRHGSLVSETYFDGEDWNNHEGAIGVVRHGRETLHDVRSISKSVVTLALLVAHERGKIESLDQKLIDFFPDYTGSFASDEKKSITIRHALTMTAGLEWNENIPYTDPANDGSRLARADDPIGFVLSRDLVSRPGEIFNYSGGLTQVLAAIVERTTGEDVYAYAKANILDPLGVIRSEWAPRRDGKPDADSGLRLSARDLSKIGLLYAGHGSWNGKRIIAADLIHEAASAHILLPQGAESAALGERQSYGYQTWLFSFPSDGQEVTLIELAGNGGQKVYVDAARDLMVVMTAGNYDRRDLNKWPLDIYFDIVAPALAGR